MNLNIIRLIVPCTFPHLIILNAIDSILFLFYLSIYLYVFYYMVCHIARQKYNTFWSLYVILPLFEFIFKELSNRKNRYKSCQYFSRMLLSQYFSNFTKQDLHIGSPSVLPESLNVFLFK